MKKLFTSLCLIAFTLMLTAQEFVALPVAGNDTVSIIHAGVSIADIDSDGNLDLVMSGQVFFDSPDTTVILMNNGDKTFTSSDAPNVIKAGFLACIDHGDIDADGDIDFIFNGWADDASTGVALNDGSGAFTLGSYEMLQSAPGCAFADLNNDALMDYVSLGNGLSEASIYFQNSDGTFTKNQTAFSDLNLIDAVINIIDFNNDGYLDMFLNAGWDEENGGRVGRVYINDYFGGFAVSAQANLIRKGFGSSTWYDVDADGNLDLLLNGDGSDESGEANDNIYRLYKNNNGTLEEAATFNDYRQISTGGGGQFADIDNDGDADIILTGWSDSEGRQATVLFECTDAANFAYTRHTWSDSDQVPGVSESHIEVADLNNDHKIDIIVTGYAGQFDRAVAGVVFNDMETANTVPGAPSSLALADIDGGGVMFSWDAGTDTETPVAALTYSLYLKDVTNSKWLINPEADLASGKRKVSGLGNRDNSLEWPIYNLPDGDYEWSVQAVDGIYEGSAFPTPIGFSLTNGAIVGIDKATVATYTLANLSSLEGELHIQFMEEVKEASVIVYSITGQKVFNSSSASSVLSMPLNDGIYIVNIISNGRSQTSKVVVL
jgi:hypothetical protein